MVTVGRSPRGEHFKGEKLRALKDLLKAILVLGGRIEQLFIIYFIPARIKKTAFKDN